MTVHYSTICLLLCSFACATASLSAQEAINLPSQSGMTSSTATLPEPGTVMIDYPNAISLRLEQSLSSATAHRGDVVRFTLLQNLSLNGAVVATPGMTVTAKVSHVRQKNNNHPGELEISDAKLFLANGGSLRLAARDSGSHHSCGDFAGTLLMFAIVLPIELPMVPLQLASLAVHDMHRRHQQAVTNPPQNEKTLAQGEVVTYYTHGNARTNLPMKPSPQPRNGSATAPETNAAVEAGL